MNTSLNPAVVAKIRALYGTRIGPEQYKELAHCKSVPDIAAYLKSSTRYAQMLQNVSEATIHRG